MKDGFFQSDPRKVYEGEVRKTQCSHFFKGRCRYDLYCQASHYTQKQLDQLRQIGENLIKEKQPAAATKQFNSSEEKKPQSRKRKRTKAKDLPPSLRPIQLNKLANLIDKNNTWG
ncbi:uncharacterized protein LOC106091990 isoform X2 [Stomoxys calcitrans]|uniref:C3H1-type domain-containing protein n=1 Tax=Stomoxys calcitrans TaxID=35570 RepID=A0A1I8NXZ3_STOCA|nr:uncharacterized protein LOC106091990 isoform X2 [Stomoxys calcitrans]